MMKLQAPRALIRKKSLFDGQIKLKYKQQAKRKAAQRRMTRGKSLTLKR